MNRLSFQRFRSTLGAGAIIVGLSGCDQNPKVAPPDRTVTSRDADNTANNAPARDGNQTTPMDQSEKPADVKITAEIRRALMDDTSMSMNAKNCKVITSAGTVTLEGVVDSQVEKDSVESKARAVAGVSNVINRLDIKGA